ncbi:hypothetical protein Pmani_039057 [Petrolisthes manimaculis]|uniref:Uncharacterized protein n=1 Tax=Petrolisthes manimaculis TaxID=1843537 RepID=A0AAE1ND68_9EUCA|nr:hypothetical protein Pmani_039057 [Petrolisthes manimaculis]
MSPSRKSKRQIKPTAKLDGFIYDDGTEKDNDGEPRRSRRTPKLSEKLLTYMTDKSQTSKATTTTTTTTTTTPRRTSQKSTTTKTTARKQTGMLQVLQSVTVSV